MAPKHLFITAFSLLAGLSHAQSTLTLAASAGTIPSFPSVTSAASSQGSSSVISFYFDDADPQELVGSVISANPTMTAIFFECADTDQCGFSLGANLTIENKNTFIVTMTEGDEFDFRGECISYAADSIVCSDSIGGAEANTQSGQPSADTNMASLMPITITAGLDKLTAAATGSSSATKSASPSKSKTSSVKKTGSGTSTATGSVPTSNAGRLQVWSALGLLSIGAIIMSL